MIYFVITYHVLDRSKKYFDTIEEIKTHLSQLCKKLKTKPSEEDLENSITILKIDEFKIPEYPKLFKQMAKSSPPWSRKDQINKEREEEKEFSEFKKYLKEIKIC